MVKILVTGGAGYIGSHVVDLLKKRGHKPIVLDNLIYGHRNVIENVLKTPIIVGNVGDEDLICKILNGTHPACNGEKIEAIMHFAAFAYVGESVEDPMKYYLNNVNDSLKLLSSLLKEQKNRISEGKPKIPIVFSSSCATYGITDSQPISEDSPQIPINPYGRSKLIIENMLQDFWSAYKMPSVIFRYFNASGADLNSRFGENHNPETHLIPLIFKAGFNINKYLNVYGDDYPTKDGTCIRDYVHVIDIADAHLKGLEHVLNKEGNYAYNIGSGTGYSINEIIKEVEVVTKLSIPIKITKRRSGDPPILFASSKKLKKELNWYPNYSDLRTIIETAYKWHKKLFLE